MNTVGRLEQSKITDLQNQRARLRRAALGATPSRRSKIWKQLIVINSEIDKLHQLSWGK